METITLTDLSDSELLARVQRLAQTERRVTSALVSHLAEIDHRKLYLREGCSSLFVYCMRVLHLSEHAAYFRIEAARVSRRFPAVLTALERGDLHLSAVRLLARILTPENHRELLAAARHKTKGEIRELVARVHPQPDVPDVVRKLPAKPRGGTALPGVGGASSSATASSKAERADAREAEVGAVPSSSHLASTSSCSASAASAVAVGASAGFVLEAAPPARRAEVVPLAPQRYKVQFTASAATYDKLRRAQELLRHRMPHGEVADVIDEALDLLVRDLERRKIAATDRPRPAAAGLQRGASSRHIPAEVRRAVWQRDQGCCAFVSPGGTRCRERGPLEFDHIHPHGDGGDATVDNVRLLCRAHNRYEAQQFFGVWQAGNG